LLSSPCLTARTSAVAIWCLPIPCSTRGTKVPLRPRLPRRSESARWPRQSSARVDWRNWPGSAPGLGFILGSISARSSRCTSSKPPRHETREGLAHRKSTMGSSRVLDAVVERFELGTMSSWAKRRSHRRCAVVRDEKRLIGRKGKPSQVAALGSTPGGSPACLHVDQHGTDRDDIDRRVVDSRRSSTARGQTGIGPRHLSQRV